MKVGWKIWKSFCGLINTHFGIWMDPFQRAAGILKSLFSALTGKSVINSWPPSLRCIFTWMSQNAHILAECFCIIAQQSNSTDAPLPKTWHFQAKHYFNNTWYDRKSAHLFYLCIINMGRAFVPFNPVPSRLCHVIDYYWDTKYPYLGGIELRLFGSQCCVRYAQILFLMFQKKIKHYLTQH